MKRADSSAPSWGFVPQTPEPIHSFRRALPGAPEVLARPKTIPLGETHTPSHTPGKSRTSNDVLSIEQERASRVASCQLGATVQVRELTDTDAVILEALRELDRIASAKEIANAAELHIDTVRRRLDRLVGDGRVVVLRRGYVLRERA